MKDFKWNLLLLLVLIFNAFSCQDAPEATRSDRQAEVEAMAESFFETYAEREDWEKLCAYYREDLEFEDVFLQLKLDSLWKFKRFYNWPDTNFSKLYPEQKHIVIETLVVDDSVAVGRGHLNPFYWYGEKIDVEWGMEVIFWLFFDEDLKIKRQIDWIEYDPDVMEAVIARVRAQGSEKLPDWLDLSRD